MAVPAKGGRSSYQYMDMLRFVAAAVVVLNHARDLLIVDAADAGNQLGLFAKAVYFIAGLGHEAVMVFFVLSGFWITRAVDRRKDDEVFWRPYLTDRLSRLLIVLIPALVIGGLIDAWGIFSDSLHYSGGSPATSVPDNIAKHLTVAAFVGNTLFLQGLAVPTFGSNGPLWSLAYEFWFYLWFPAIFFVLRRRWTIALISLSIAVIWPKVALGFVVWLMGTALYFWDKAANGRERVTGKGRRVVFSVLGAAGLFTALMIARLNILPLTISDILVGGAFFWCIWNLLRSDPPFPRLFRCFATYGSRASYSLYAIHYPVLMAILAATGLAARLLPTATAFASLMGLIAFAAIVGWLFSLLTEARTPALRGWLSQRFGS